VNTTTLRSPRLRARGLGAAHAGSGAFLWERLTAAALIPLGAWLALALVHLSADGVTLAEARAWLGHPVRGTLVWATFVLAMVNAYLCSRVLLEDYVHRPALSFLALIGLIVLTAGLALTVTVAIASVMFGS
jgi:succinate dehydrogenase / fumarate reductase, membrane anchor subunit